ncbi:hypothetical protein STEG23_009264 [Scotinomys teguina]
MNVDSDDNGYCAPENVQQYPKSFLLRKQTSMTILSVLKEALHPFADSRHPEDVVRSHVRNQRRVDFREDKLDFREDKLDFREDKLDFQVDKLRQRHTDIVS